jgi:tRNA (guanine37-N1)-methyltransferase
MRIDVVTIFPDYLAPLDVSLLGKARERGLIDVHIHDLRTWTDDVHRTVDDSPYGGGPGMVMRPQVWGEALDAVLAEAGPARLVVPTPAGRPFTQATAQAWAGESRLVFACGRYEGIDQRVVDDAASRMPVDEVTGSTGEEAAVDEHGPLLVVPTPSGELFTQTSAQELAVEPWLVFACGRYEGIDQRVVDHARTRMRVRELSIGDYVLNGGEVAALVITEAVVRLLPGFMGNPASLAEESHGADGLLEYPVYTKPPSWRGLDVPDVLRSGNHAAIARWRRDRALERTATRRPDLFDALPDGALDRADRAFLAGLDG